MKSSHKGWFRHCNYNSTLFCAIVQWFFPASANLLKPSKCLKAAAADGVVVRVCRRKGDSHQSSFLQPSKQTVWHIQTRPVFNKNLRAEKNKVFQLAFLHIFIKKCNYIHHYCMSYVSLEGNQMQRVWNIKFTPFVTFCHCCLII